MRPRLLGGILWAAPTALALTIAAPAGAAPRLPAAGHVLSMKVVARERPDPAASAVHVFRDFRRDFRPQYVFAVHEQDGADGQVWAHVELPMRPNGALGWIPAASAELQTVTTTIVVHRGARHLEVYRTGRRVFRTVVAAGKPGAGSDRDPPLGGRR